jgi:glycosyltransferase involved in cell wall biosynthesis
MSAPPTVCFVLAGHVEDPAAVASAAALERRGWSVYRLAEPSGRADEEVQRFGGDDPTVVLGERLGEDLERLHAEHSFDLIEFADPGVAMRSVQAKRSGDAFLDVPLAVRPDVAAFLRRAGELRTLAAPRQLKLDFCQRYAFEGADLQVAGSDEVLALVDRHGWAVGADAVVAALAEGGEDDGRIEDLYRGLVGRAGADGTGTAGDATLTVVVAHYNHERYLEGALASLAGQTRPPDEVIVIDDGSTSEAALRVFDDAEARYPDWRFIRQPNAGPGATRNRGLELATSRYFLPFDSDNLAVETMVERLLGAMERNPSRAATACHNLGFTADKDIAAGRFVSRYSPTGGPLVLAAVENVFGDTCSIFDIAALRSVGGFEVNTWSPTEDWETFVKLATRGLEIDVLPRPLFYYRTNAGGRLQHLGTDRATKLRLRAHLLDEFFAGAAIDEAGRRELVESLQAFDDFAEVGVDARLAEQREWHDSQMADLDGFRERQEEAIYAQAASEAARAEAERVRAEAERARAESAERSLAELRQATSGWLVSKLVRLHRR